MAVTFLTNEDKQELITLGTTASVGQTIVVKEVDENGKPTKWESADYQPRTHWTGDGENLPATTIEIDPDTGMGLVPDFTVEGGKTYTITYNGVEYECNCLESESGLIFGNGGAVIEGAPVTEDPFILACNYMDDGTKPWVVIPLDGSASVSLSVFGELVTKIPDKYMPSSTKAYYVNLFSDDGETCFTTETPEKLLEEYRKGRPIFAKLGIDVYHLSYVNDGNGEVGFCLLEIQGDESIRVDQMRLIVAEGAYTVVRTVKP